MADSRIAKKNLFINVSTNLLNVGVTALILVWLTPYLIRHLGVSAYGVYPLINTIAMYFVMFSSSYTGAVARFTAVSIDRNEEEARDIYFSTAFYSLLSTNLVLLGVVVIISYFLPALINIPTGFEQGTRWLFVFVMFSALCNTLASPFWVGTFVTHRFYMRNYSEILSRILQVAVIVGGFWFFGASLTFIGLGRSGMFLFQLGCAVYLTGLLLPRLRLRRSLFSWTALGEMSRMSGWMTIDAIGTLLYLSTDLLVINLIAGPEKAGLYAIVLQWVLLLQTLTPAISRVFAPVAIDFIAKGDLPSLSFHTQRAVKFMGLLLALPVGLVCGLSFPLLHRWVGAEFAHLSPLLTFLMVPQVVFLSISPLYNINRGMNKVKIPAIVTLVGGLSNLILSVVLLKYTQLGLYGVALATVLTYLARSMAFTPIYTALILDQPATRFLKPIVPGLLMLAAVATSGWAASQAFDLASYPALISFGAVAALAYAPTCFLLALESGDRSFLLSLIVKKSHP